jgi:hypothetical protein
VRRLDWVRAAALGFLAATLSACYAYTAAPPSGARVGERVRVRVSGAEADRLEPTLGSSGRSIEGDLLEVADSSIALSVALPYQLDATTMPSRAQQRIVIPRAELQQLELRRLDKVRTSLLIGVGVAGVVAIAASKGSSLIGGSGGGGSPNERRVPVMAPLLRWRFSLP